MINIIAQANKSKTNQISLAQQTFEDETQINITENDHSFRIYNYRQGICRNMPKQQLQLYFSKFKQILQTGKDIIRIDSVNNWKREILDDPVCLMHFQAALKEIPKEVASSQFSGKLRKGILFGYTIDEAFELLNAIAQTPPIFSLSELCGVPIGILLIDITNTQSGKKLFALPQTNKNLKCIFDDYGAMLKSKKSLKYFNSEQGGWMCPEALKLVDYTQIQCDLSAPCFGFDSWNSWFIRKFKQGKRPSDSDQAVIVHAAENYPLTNVELPFKNLKKTDEFWLKENLYSLYDMFEAEKMGIEHIIDQSFVGGTLYQGYLSPWCYHWLHSPVSGKIIGSYRLQGCYFLQNPCLDITKPNNYDNSQAFLSCVSTRHVFIIDTQNPLIGRVAIIAIGMVEVSSCIAIVNEGDYVKKGEQIGRFQFGGSSHVVIFDRKANLEFNPSIYLRQNRGGFQVSVRQNINSNLAKIIPNKQENI